MSRREFPARVKVAAFDRCKGFCEGKDCGVKLVPGRFQYDHDIPDAMGGEPTLENCVVLCSACHLAKTTGTDVPRIAKTKRQRSKHLRATTSSRPMPGSRASGWKKPFNKPAVRREP